MRDRFIQHEKNARARTCASASARVRERAREMMSFVSVIFEDENGFEETNAHSHFLSLSLAPSRSRLLSRGITVVKKSDKQKEKIKE